jgi:hypothetical protein
LLEQIDKAVEKLKLDNAKTMCYSASMQSRTKGIPKGLLRCYKMTVLYIKNEKQKKPTEVGLKRKGGKAPLITSWRLVKMATSPRFD